ncbi:hypothetical protein TNCV_1519501 [Trichonephila clavipes]|nr:hypothetical protein TNCV_1519501 [Trichonephila clavipes]
MISPLRHTKSQLLAGTKPFFFSSSRCGQVAGEAITGNCVETRLITLSPTRRLTALLAESDESNHLLETSRLSVQQMFSLFFTGK